LSNAVDFWGPPIPGADDYVDAVFGAGGYLARRWGATYRPRDGQIELARAVDAAIHSRTHLLSEAPTGCHAAGQLVTMHDGSLKKVEDVVVGDRLMGPDWRPRTVFGLARGQDHMVDVTPARPGWDRWRVNRGHILTLCPWWVKDLSQTVDFVDASLADWVGWPDDKRTEFLLVRVFRDQRPPACMSSFRLRETGTVEPYFGFTLDGDGRFLLGDGTVTHNTGKSLAYSVPATYHAAVNAKTVVIVTANIALQEQLFQKDLPLLAEVLPWSFSYGLMKGRGNYLCRSQYEKQRLEDRQQPMFADERSVPANERDRVRLVKWADHEVATHGYGDQSSLGWKPADKLWREFSVAPEECKGHRCAHKDTCGALAAQRKARASQVVVTNYHVFFTHLLVWMDRGVDAILPAFDAVVFDECFPAGTMVGDVPIESIRVGDEVDSFDRRTGTYVRRRVTNRFVRQAMSLVRLVIDGGAVLVCTPGHPILAERGWVAAGNLHEEDYVFFRREGNFALPSRVDRVEAIGPDSNGVFGDVCPDGFVYNLAIEETETYVANGFVVHNCHKAPDVARDFFGWRYGEGSFKKLARHVRGTHPQLTDGIERAAGWFFQQMFELRRDRDRYKARVVPARLNGHDVTAGEQLLAQLSEFTAIVDQEIAALDTLGSSAEAGERAHGAEQAKGRAQKLSAAVSGVLGGADEDEVIFVEEDEFHTASIACRLVRPGRVLAGGLFGKTVRHPTADGTDAEYPVSVVCTSATLATESGFGFARSELGVGEACELTVDSPFDYPNQALLILPDIVEPNDPRFGEECAALLLRTIILARGRTLGLFTSRKRMNEVFEAIAGQTPYRILKQDDGQRTHLVEEFRRDTHSVLLGVSSFWAGVDVPGESLSCVFIDKIPFPTPDDPVVERLTETDKRAWGKYAVPRAIIEFKQGFGRLIRSDTDRGVVVCCDARIRTKGYGKQFLRAMPKGMQKVKNLDALRDWLDDPAALTAPPPPPAPPDEESGAPGADDEIDPLS
jgi:Rad3-related DNA helicase